MTFDASASLGAIVAYAWDFTGDGVADREGPRVRWTFAAPGFYLVTLTVTDDLGDEAQVSVLVQVAP